MWGRVRASSIIAAAVVIAAHLVVSAPIAGAEPPTAYSMVALGDSAAAAPLVPYLASPIQCWRSTENYPAVTARRLGAELRDVTCSSARTEDIAARGQTTQFGSVPPQLDAVTAEADLVTVTIGGNDVGLVQVAQSCIEILPPAIATTSCVDRYVVDGVDTVSTDIDRRMPVWSAVLDSIRHRAPDARIVVVGYATYLPPGGCYPVQPIHPVAADYVQAKIDQVNAAWKSVAASRGAEFFDTRPVTTGHDTCATPADRYLEGVVPTHPATPLHPNGPGSAAIGRALADYLER